MTSSQADTSWVALGLRALSGHISPACKHVVLTVEVSSIRGSHRSASPGAAAVVNCSSAILETGEPSVQATPILDFLSSFAVRLSKSEKAALRRSTLQLKSSDVGGAASRKKRSENSQCHMRQWVVNLADFGIFAFPPTLQVNLCVNQCTDLRGMSDYNVSPDIDFQMSSVTVIIEIFNGINAQNAFFSANERSGGEGKAFAIFFRFCQSFTSNFPFPFSFLLSLSPFPSSSFPFLFLYLPFPFPLPPTVRLRQKFLNAI